MNSCVAVFLARDFCHPIAHVLFTSRCEEVWQWGDPLWEPWNTVVQGRIPNPFPPL